MSKIAIIKSGGKQYVVKEGEKLNLERLSGVANDSIEFETLLISDEAGEKTEIGTPVLSSKVKGTIMEQGREAKLTVIKFRAKSRYRRKMGHRQHYTRVKIEKI